MIDNQKFERCAAKIQEISTDIFIEQITPLIPIIEEIKSGTVSYINYA